MGSKSIRLASTITLDETQEADIIQLINDFNSSHRMGEFITNLLRIAAENPEIVVKKDGKYSEGALLDVMMRLGKYPPRQQYLDRINSKVDDMHTKVNEMYNMCLEMHTAFEMGKRLGMETKVENMALATFMAEKCVSDLEKITGNKLGNSTYESNKLEKYEDRAENILEYILSSYEPIINAMQAQFKPIEIPVTTKVMYVEEIDRGERPISAQPVASQPAPAPAPAPAPVKNDTIDIKPSNLIAEEAEPEVIFDDSNIDALNSFLGL